MGFLCSRHAVRLGRPYSKPQSNRLFADQPDTPPFDETANDRLPTSGKSGPRISFMMRIAGLIAVLLGVGPLILLGVALTLNPSKSGLGTHQQLGLPPCSMRVLFGVRCPACGMTTSWSHFARGQWIDSVMANPGGFLLALYSFPFAVCCFWFAAKGRLPNLRVQNAMIWTLLAIAIVSAANWFVRLATESGG